MVYFRHNHQAQTDDDHLSSPFASDEETHDLQEEDMPTIAKKAPKRSSAKASKVISVASSMPPSANVCRSCHILPIGSVDLTALMLVLVFSLTAVLFTTVYALNLQKAKVVELERQVATYRQ